MPNPIRLEEWGLRPNLVCLDSDTAITEAKNNKRSLAMSKTNTAENRAVDTAPVADGIIEAINRVQAVIEFELDGKVLLEESGRG